MNGTVFTTIVVTDASILVNFCHTNHLRLLAALPYSFVVPDEVLAEVLMPDQKDQLDKAFEQRWLTNASLCAPQELEVFAELSGSLGIGEASCLALAQTRGWLVACDERRTFLREAVARLGKARVLNTPGIYVLAIRAGVLSVEEADHAKAILAERRFRMKFNSFRDVL